MEKVDFYKKRYEAMDLFYSWVDQGSEYDMAVDQGSYYSIWKDDFDEIMYYVTVASRFARGGRTLSKSFKETLEGIIQRARNLDLVQYGLTPYEIECFNEDVMDAAGMLR